MSRVQTIPLLLARWCLALGGLLAPWVARAAPATPPLVGRFDIVPEAAPADGLPTGGTVDIDPRRSTYAVIVHPEAGKTLRGLGLSEGGDLAGFSLYTGGIAHGLAIYRRTDGGQHWRGRWISSIDGGSDIGVMDLDADPKAPTLAGRHPFSGHRSSSGEFDGAVTLTPRGDDFILTYTTAGGAILYRGVGVVRGERLVVAWSFGSNPALAVYSASAGGEVDGRRVALRSRGAVEAVSEHLVPAGLSPRVMLATPDAKAPVTAAAAAPLPAPGGSEAMSAAEPSAPAVKTCEYNDLMTRYGSDGWAERWLDRQLTADEMHLLQLAVRRHRVGDPASDVGNRTVAQLIDEERRPASR